MVLCIGGVGFVTGAMLDDLAVSADVDVRIDENRGERRERHREPGQQQVPARYHQQSKPQECQCGFWGGAPTIGSVFLSEPAFYSSRRRSFRAAAGFRSWPSGASSQLLRYLKPVAPEVRRACGTKLLNRAWPRLGYAGDKIPETTATPSTRIAFRAPFAGSMPPRGPAPHQRELCFSSDGARPRMSAGRRHRFVRVIADVAGGACRRS